MEFKTNAYAQPSTTGFIMFALYRVKTGCEFYGMQNTVKYDMKSPIKSQPPRQLTIK